VVQPKKKAAGDLPSFKEKLQSLQAKDKISFIIRQPMPLEKRSAGVVMLTLKTNLSAKARGQPMLAWKELVKATTGVSPLLISLVNPSLAEVTFELVDAPAAKEKLDKLGVVVDDLELSDKDLTRRSVSYHRGFFLPLRRQALQGFSLEQKLAVLQVAEASVDRLVVQHLRKPRRLQIAVDRAWLHETEGMGE
jgi:hypothetical protein